MSSGQTIDRWEPLLGNTQRFNDEQRDWISDYAQAHSTDNFQHFCGGVDPINPKEEENRKPTDWTGINLLPISMKIAAQTIGMDLVAVKPCSSPKIELLFVDFKYDGSEYEPYKPKINDPLDRDEEDQDYEDWVEE